MSSQPSSGQSSQLLGQTLRQNGSSRTCTQAAAASASCGNLVTDQVLLREVAEIAEKVRVLEKSVPCQVEFFAHDKHHNPEEGAVAAEVQQDVQGGGGGVGGSSASAIVSECEPSKSHVNVQAMSQSRSTTNDHDDGGAVSGGATTTPEVLVGSGGGDADGVKEQEPDEAQQSSERLIIKLDTNKSSAVMGDNMKSGSECHVVCPAAASAAMNEDDIKALVKELKRKIEYTERMNWLCKYCRSSSSSSSSDHLLGE